MPKLASLPLATAALILALAASVSAQDYPTKPIRMIIPFPPGGGSDVTGRVCATELWASAWETGDRRQPRRRGRRHRLRACGQCAEGWLYAVDGVARAHGQSVALRPERPLRSDQVLCTGRRHCGEPGHAGGQSRRCGQFGGGFGRAREATAGKAAIRLRGRRQRHASGGELFKHTAKVDMLHVPFRGAGPATIDVIGGHTSFMFGGLLATTAACPIGQAACARGRLAHAQSGLPRCAVDRRSRRARL